MNHSQNQNIPEKKEIKKNSVQQKKQDQLIFSSKDISSHLKKITISVPPSITQTVYKQTIELFKNRTIEGFNKEGTPSEYIEQTFGKEIQNKVKHYLFKHHGLGFLMEEIIRRKIPISNYPRLEKIHLLPDKSVTICFDISIADKITFKEWKHFSFRPPKRKKYKDLDKQVVQFLDKEVISPKKLNTDTVQDHDWVFFNASLLNKDKTLPSKNLSSTFWIRIKQNEIGDPFAKLFLNRKINESFITKTFDMEYETNEVEHYGYNYLIKIIAIIKGTHLVLDHFKTMFKLKNKLEIHNKLMEVFSYRNDQSQRKSTIEEIFHLFLTKHRFEVPKHLILRRQEDILYALSKKPDYQVYKAQEDFYDQIELMAEKQLKEEILIDQIAYNENLKVELKDIQHYLQLFNSKRLREFVYFKPLLEPIDTLNAPMNAGLLSNTVLREKTLNSVIYILTH